MKRLIILLVAGLLMMLGACSGEETDSEPVNAESDQDKGAEESEASGSESANFIKGTVKPEEFDKVFSAPKEYKGYELSFTGRVFVKPERDTDGTYLQVYADPENSELNTIVGIEDPNLDVSNGDYVQVDGIIQDEIQGQNAFGGTINAPVVQATAVDVVDYVTAVSPAIETFQVDKSQDQHGYVVHLNKIEIAENMTRVYVKVTNNTDDEISFYSFNSKLLLDNKQLEEEHQYDTGLPEVQSDILPGMETEGVITFPSVDPSTESLTFHAEGSSMNYEVEFEPFIFEIEN
ncbi:hypothetical protein SAMN05216238_101294 [Lentibacillus persicus]|uniref:DUF4352 domain-containing protein n=1 Tax=Lentibacillus persicus TaxID=640948 RepID=A0A1I1SDX2_9BACI|nr:hypothetical protein [Lentibacillus persicus]SFD42818.1 hypothetical protein SAMN05216238_101294 [Lentibacillus persicus]